MRQTTFKLNKGSEYPERFKGHEVRLDVPETMDELRGFVAQDAPDADAAIVGAVNGQGLLLTMQKTVKSTLASDDVKELDVPAALEAARKAAQGTRIGAPRARGEGRASKVSKLTAEKEQLASKVDAALEAVQNAYLTMPKGMRKSYGEQLVTAGVLTAEQVEELDNRGK